MSDWPLPIDPYVLQVETVSTPREECSMCSRTKDKPDSVLFRLSSNHENRRSVFYLCGFCKNDLLHQIEELEGDV